MGKNVTKKPTFGGMFDGLEPTNTDNPTYNHTPTHTPTEEVVVKKERRSRKMNFLMEPSKAERFKAYAEKHDISMNELIGMLVDEFLEKNS